MPFKNPLTQADDLLKEARRNTLNQRINYKGNYENYITGGSHALDNQVFKDSNDYVKGMTAPGNGWGSNDWLKGLNPRYSNPQHEERQAFHRYTPSTRRGRRASDIWFQAARNGQDNPTTLDQIQQIVNKYEGVK